MARMQGVIQMNDKALHEFMSRISEARERLAELTAYVDDHMQISPDEISWGNVGNAGYLVEQLSQLTDWAFSRGEYAE